MANTIQIKRGAASGLPTLAVGELAFTTDTFRVYAGSSGGNKLIGEADFVKLSGSTMTGALTLSGAPTNDLHAATKAYVDAARTGLAVKAACRVATAAALPAHVAISNNVITASANGVLTIDGVAVALNDRVLVKNEGSGTHLENGIYYVSQLGTAGAPWKLTRVADADSSAEVPSGMFVFVSEGAANADAGFVLTTNDPITLNTTALTFTQFSGAGQITAGNGLTKTGNTINAVGTANRITVAADSIDIASTYVGQTSITTLGTIATGTWNGTAIAANKGGTGVANNAANTITFSGAYGLTLTLSGTTSVTLPTSGTLATTSQLHTQNTDTGTTNGTFTVGSSGPKLEKVTASVLNLKTNAGTEYASFSAKDVTIFPTGADAGYSVKFTGATLTAHRTITFPNTDGTVALTSQLHTQDTDWGTTRETFQLESGFPGIKLKNDNGLGVRNSSDNAYAPVRAAAIVLYGDQGGLCTSTIAAAGGSSFTQTLPSLTGTLLNDFSTIDGGTW